MIAAGHVLPPFQTRRLSYLPQWLHHAIPQPPGSPLALTTPHRRLVPPITRLR